MAEIRDRNRLAETSTGFLTKPVVQANPVAFHSVAQLAVRWGISERQVHRYIDSGDLVTTRFGRSIRVSTAQVARFEASRTVVK
jgi:excisionase family DNA binding protein